MKKLKYIDPKKIYPSLSEIKKISPKKIPISAYARIQCTHCGLFSRGILCPPLLTETYPQFKTIDSSRKYVDSFTTAYIYIFKNDGRKRYWLKNDQDKFNHIRLVRRRGRQLKGIEKSSARQLTLLMNKIRRANEKNGRIVDCFIPGHCDKCSRICPNRENPPCKRGGMPSMEAIGVNVHLLLENLEIDYEFPPVHYLLQVTMMLVK